MLVVGLSVVLDIGIGNTKSPNTAKEQQFFNRSSNGLFTTRPWVSSRRQGFDIRSLSTREAPPAWMENQDECSSGTLAMLLQRFDSVFSRLPDVYDTTRRRLEFFIMCLFVIVGSAVGRTRFCACTSSCKQHVLPSVSQRQCSVMKKRNKTTPSRGNRKMTNDISKGGSTTGSKTSTTQ